jgi:uncharacterized protein (DUF779 family)
MADVIAFAAGRVSVSDAARQLIETLKEEYGALMFHQSGGCCDGSAPMCFQVGEFKLGEVDEKVGEIAGCEFWMDREQFRRWAHTQWMVDVVPGRGASFSLEAPLNMRFLIRSSLCAGSPSAAESSTVNESRATGQSPPAPRVVPTR